MGLEFELRFMHRFYKGLRRIWISTLTLAHGRQVFGTTVWGLVGLSCVERLVKKGFGFWLGGRREELVSTNRGFSLELAYTVGTCADRDFCR